MRPGAESKRDAYANANHVLDQLAEAVDRLSRSPEHRNYPKELIALGIKEYRRASFKPYHVIYRIGDWKVVIYLIADGRHDMQSMLGRRLLGV